MGNRGKKGSWGLIGVILAVGLELTGCGGAGGEAGKDAARLSAQGQARWLQFPVDIYVEDRIVNSPAEADVLAALAFWEAKTSRKLFNYRGAVSSPVSGGRNLVNPMAAPVNQAFFQSPWPYENNMLALNMRVEQNGAIQRSLITINDNYLFCYGECTNDPAVGFRKVLTHELGHFLGFDHHASPRNVMYAFYQPSVGMAEYEVDWAMIAALIR